MTDPQTDHRQFLLDCCLGNRDAASFAAAYLDYCHAVDDAVDQDNNELNTPDYFIKTQMEMFFALSSNPFYLANKESLLSLMLQGFIDWGDSMKWAASDDKTKVYASDWLKSGYHSVFFHIALIVGGVEHCRKITAAYRKFDYDHGQLNTSEVS